MAKTLFILYNADASIMGKLKYSYRKLTTPKDCTPACAACDITHGGLHLDETSDWKRVKGEVAKNGGMEVKQLHRDELGGDVSSFLPSRLLFTAFGFVCGGRAWVDLELKMKGFISDSKLQFPMVLATRSGQEEQGRSGYDVVMDKEELATFGGSADRFLEGLQKKGVLSASSSASSL